MPGSPAALVAGSVYAGVDARAGEIVNRSHWLPSKLQYPVASVRALATYRPIALTVEVDGNRSEHRAANVVIANSRFYGKGMAIAPDASIDDGELDVIVIEAAGRLDLIRALPKVYDGAHVALDEVKVLRGTRVTVSGRYAGTGGTVPVGADGEALGELPGAGERAAHRRHPTRSDQDPALSPEPNVHTSSSVGTPAVTSWSGSSTKQNASPASSGAAIEERNSAPGAT